MKKSPNSTQTTNEQTFVTKTNNKKPAFENPNAHKSHRMHTRHESICNFRISITVEKPRISHRKDLGRPSKTWEGQKCAGSRPSITVVCRPSARLWTDGRTLFVSRFFFPTLGGRWWWKSRSICGSTYPWRRRRRYPSRAGRRDRPSQTKLRRNADRKNKLSGVEVFRNRSKFRIFL